MPVLKPIRGIRLNKSHPLARGLVGYWLLNEGSGNKVFDLSGNGNTGTFGAGAASPSWAAGKFGSALSFDGGDYANSNFTRVWGTSESFTFCLWIKTTLDGLDEDTKEIFGFVHELGDNDPGIILCQKELTASGIDDNYLTIFLRDDNGNNTGWTPGSIRINDNIWHFIILVKEDGIGIRTYVDGVLDLSEADPTNTTISMLSAPYLGARNNRGAAHSEWTGELDVPMIFNRALSASEIALLYREPFCMFDRAWRPLELGGQIVELAGTTTATSSVEGSLSVSGPIVELAGTIAGRSNVNGYLSLLDWTERSRLTEALFNGMTANAFKLGTSLSLGWFWVRVTGCSVLYRGAGMGEIDFGGVANILAVSNLDDYGGGEISPPSYIPHDGGSTYFYVVRRFNKCGYQEHTLAAAVKVVFDSSSGELTEPQPNSISSVRVEQVDSNKIRLTWLYCPIEQGSVPIKFNVYYDDRTGQIDYENPLDIIEYKGRRFYSFQSPDLETGEGADEHLFAIRAEDADGIENSSLARLKIQLDTLSPDTIKILRAEAV